MALMDAYGLSLMDVEVWGILWGVLSFGFVIGGLGVAKFGLGNKPLRILIIANTIMWLSSTFFTIRPSILLLAIGCLIYVCLVPVIEAIEQTIIQRLVPLARQGRVFGFAESIETASTPLAAFIIGPVTQFVIMPYMANGGEQFLSPLLGVGAGRSIAAVFVAAGILGLLITILARFSPIYTKLSRSYTNS